jgi:predicted Zn-dependent protease
MDDLSPSDLKTILHSKRGLDKKMEYEADESAMEVAYRTGYDPTGMIRVLKMLKRKEKNAKRKGSWFSTHPPLSLRLKKCHEWMKKYPDANQMARVKKRFALNRSAL